MLLIKIKQQDLLHDSKNISDSITCFTKVYMICLIFPSTSPLGCIHYLLPGGGGRGFFGDTKIFRTKLGGIGNFQLIYREMLNFPLILINSVSLHYKLIYHLPEINSFIICLKFLIQKMQIADETTVHYANNFKSTII